MSGKKRNSNDDYDISTMNGIDDEEIKQEDCVSLNDLLQCCSRITLASLAFPKLSAVRQKSVVADLHLIHKTDTAEFNMENDVETDEVLIQHELTINRWLEGQIDEYQATLSRRKYEKQQRYEDQQQLLLLRTNSTSFTDKGRFSNDKGGLSKAPKITKATSVATGATENDTDINVGKINLFEERGPSSLLSSTDDCESQYPVKRMKQQQQPKRSERELKDELLDITLQRYRESTLLTRIQMSQASMNTSFPHYAAVDNLGVETSSEDPSSSTSITKHPSMDSTVDHGFQLRKQALSARDFMVLSTLKTTKLLDKSRKSQNDLLQQVSVVQQENRDLWKELNCWVRQRQQQEEEYSRNCSIRYGVDTDAEQHHEVANIQQEIESIENILIHTICGSGIDWYEDSRLRQVLDRLQQKQMERNKM